MAFSNGANDVSNSFASPVGSKAIKLEHALWIASIVTFFGAFLLGGKVALRLIEGIVEPKMFADPTRYSLAMLTVLVASASFILFSTLMSMPVSSTHSIVGGLTGVSIAAAGWRSVDWLSLGKIALSWIVSPVIAGVFAYAMIVFIQKYIIGETEENVIVRIQKRLPIMVGVMVGVVMFILLSQTRFSTCLPLPLHVAAGASLVIGIVCFGVFIPILKKWLAGKKDRHKTGEGIFRKFQTVTACYVAFAHGANDVSNSVSPLYAVYVVYTFNGIPDPFIGDALPLWILALGGVGIILGILMLGKNVIRTLGGRITAINNSKGFSIEFSVATTVATASAMGMPISTTHAATGAIVGAGLSSGLKHIQFGMLGKILITWIVTVPCAAIIAIVIYKILEWVLL